MAYNSRFKFVGDVLLPKSFYKEGTTKSGDDYVTISVGIKQDNVNVEFAKLFGMKRNEIFAYDNEGERINIPWDERFDEEWLNRVPSYRKFVVDLGDDYGREEFLSEYDTIVYLKNKLPEYKGKLQIVGNYRKNPGNDRFPHDFSLRGVYGVDDNRRNELTLTVDVFYNKNCVDKVDAKSDKRITINGFICQYINSDVKERYLPFTTTFDFSKLDPENDMHAKRLKYLMSFIDIKNKTYVHIPWECKIVRGEILDFDESMLTDAQRMQVELGIADLDDFRPAGQIAGESIEEFRFVKPILKGDFDNGLVDTEITESDFEDEIYDMTDEKPIEKPAPKSSKKKVEEPTDDDIDDIFGDLL